MMLGEHVLKVNVSEFNFKSPCESESSHFHAVLDFP